MGSIPPELSLDCGPASTNTIAAATERTYIPRTISEFVAEVSVLSNASERMLKVDDYVKRLEDEMRKIDAFKRELPLCMLLVTDAIMALKEESMRYSKSNAEPVLEEFIPLKKNCDEDETDKVETGKEKDCRDKMNWMSSVQLWNSDNQSSKVDSSSKNSDTKKRVLEEENEDISDDFLKSFKSSSMARAFVPFKGCSNFPVMTAGKEDDEELVDVPGLSLHTIGIKKSRGDIGSSGVSSKGSGCRAVFPSVASVQSNVRAVSQTQSQIARKQRRCWSPELHRRFVEALQKLGGCQAATPKQIRELLQVDGLTNDEVKSHLQKYRLHTRRLPATTSTPSNQSVPILGGLWMPKDLYGESSKRSNSQSGSPQGPHQLGGASGGTSMTGGDSMEDEEDEKSESHSWKSHVLTSKRNYV